MLVYRDLLTIALTQKAAYVAIMYLLKAMLTIRNSDYRACLGS